MSKKAGANMDRQISSTACAGADLPGGPVLGAAGGASATQLPSLPGRLQGGTGGAPSTQA